jgi:hypothetical protein
VRKPARQQHLAAPPYNRLRHNDPRLDAIFDLLGDEPPQNEYEARLAQDYLLEYALKTADPVIRNTALVALADEVECRNGATRPIVDLNFPLHWFMAIFCIEHNLVGTQPGRVSGVSVNQTDYRWTVACPQSNANTTNVSSRKPLPAFQAASKLAASNCWRIATCAAASVTAA